MSNMFNTRRGAYLGKFMEYYIHFQKICQFEAKRVLFLMGMVAITHLLLQSVILPYGNALRSLLPDAGFSLVEVEDRFLSHQLPSNSGVKNDFGSADVHSESTDPSNITVVVKDDHHNREVDGTDDRKKFNNNFPEEVPGLIVKSGSENVGNEADDSALKNVDLSDEAQKLSERINLRPGQQFPSDSHSALDENLDSKRIEDFVKDPQRQGITLVQRVPISGSLDEKKAGVILVKNEKTVRGSDVSAMSNNNGAIRRPRLKKKVWHEMPPKTVTPIDKMNRILARHFETLRLMQPQWPPSSADKEILDAKSKILNAPLSNNIGELYAPLYRNISMFMRSYELMMQTLKVYVYKEGEKPIFHQPPIKGLYASEGWFMKLMEGNKHFVVKDPRKAHLFYMPFSSRMLEHALYVRGSHNLTNLYRYMKNYADMIAGKYPFWNRTGGSDHFLVACHDWAPYETRDHMDNCIKALCHADITVGFRIGSDVSLPETYIRYARNPLRNVGGKPPSKRDILAFYAGNNHGYVRPILLKHWKHAGAPDMKIYGPMPTSVAKRMSYIKHMQSSKFCICPKGYEVNSPRIVEAILYECVPVIISDNFVPPFFEVLNWEAFSIILAEKDIMNLRSILMSIPREKYLAMQLAVRKVQRHFLWHARPVKYDLFYMTLHSIWYNRVIRQH